MTAAAWRVLVCLLVGGAVALGVRAVWPAPALGPPVPSEWCAIPVERTGVGVACVGAHDARTRGLAAGDRVAGDRARGRMSGARMASLGVVLDVNRAPEVELATLPGIGPRIAARIVAARPFSSVGELTRVDGIGPRRLRAIAPRVIVGGGDPRTEPASSNAQEVIP